MAKGKKASGAKQKGVKNSLGTKEIKKIVKIKKSN
jgi:hypothetical protein